MSSSGEAERVDLDLDEVLFGSTVPPSSGSFGFPPTRSTGTSPDWVHSLSCPDGNSGVRTWPLKLTRSRSGGVPGAPRRVDVEGRIVKSRGLTDQAVRLQRLLSAFCDDPAMIRKAEAAVEGRRS